MIILTLPQSDAHRRRCPDHQHSTREPHAKSQHTPQPTLHGADFISPKKTSFPFSSTALISFVMAAVTPADIHAPRLASVPRAQPVPPPSSEKEVWNSSVDTFNAWWAKTGRTLFN